MVKQWVIPLARRITNPDGSFGGAVYAPISLKALGKVFAALDLGPGGAAALYHTSFRMAARFPEIPESNRRIGTPALSNHLRAAIAAGIPTDQYDFTSVIDNVHRTASVRRVEGWPYYVSIALAEEDYLAEWRHTRAYLLVFGFFMTGLVLVGMGMLHRRISRLRLATEKLAAAFKEIEAQAVRYQTLLNVATDGVHVLDANDGRLVEYSESFLRMLGYTPEQAATLTVLNWDAREISPDELAARLLARISTPSVFETKHRRRDGSVFDVEISACGIELEGRKYRYASSRDITRRKSLEAALTCSNIELEQFAYVVSHDLRQPLRMVTSYLSLLKQKLGNALDADSQTYIGYAIDGAKRMDSLVLGLLDYSRIGHGENAPVPVPLADIVAEVLLNLKIAIKEADADIFIADDLPVVTGCSQELMRLFLNLIGNAVKYRSEDRRLVVRIDWRDDGREWVVGVRDNGIGM
ncbi:MAG: PAS domain S-box protein, partial [Alphaproteobacteria bacterium]|nr:PAS domain S-box protein [Alphaproteobacteria bacterium]